MIPYLPLKALNNRFNLDAIVQSVALSGQYIRGEHVHAFEEAYAEFIGTQFCVGCGNGFDALWLMLRAYKEVGKLQNGDEIIVPANTYIATLLAITENQLTPVLVDADAKTLQIDATLIRASISKKTRAIMLVHLYGQCAMTTEISAICKEYDLLLFEDNAQAHGCEFEGARTGSLGDCAAHSFYPTKNLGAMGDAGAVTTDDAEIANAVRGLANYGSNVKNQHDFCGRNSRLDELQAAILRVKLDHLLDDNRKRQRIAEYYRMRLCHPLVTLPKLNASVFHIYPILCEKRDAMRAFLEEKGIGTMIHYPTPPHLQPCYSSIFGAHCSSRLPVTMQIAQQELSLPCHPLLTPPQVQEIADAVNAFEK